VNSKGAQSVGHEEQAATCTDSDSAISRGTWHKGMSAAQVREGKTSKLQTKDTLKGQYSAGGKTNSSR